MDYKKEFIALLDRMHEENNDGLIPIMIAEGLKKCKAYDRNAPYGNIVYWTIRHITNSIY